MAVKVNAKGEWNPNAYQTGKSQVDRLESGGGLARIPVRGLRDAIQHMNAYLGKTKNAYEITKFFAETTKLLATLVPRDEFARAAKWFSGSISPVFALTYLMHTTDELVHADSSKTRDTVKKSLDFTSAVLTNWNILVTGALNMTKPLSERVLTVVNLTGDFLEAQSQAALIRDISGQRKAIDGASEARTIHWMKFGAAISGVAIGVITVLGWFLGTVSVAPALAMMTIGVAAAALKVSATIYEQTHEMPPLV